ncbi:MAG: bifunctional ADP-dependent NAD(P)H-hydrate dehydratase/NAD(P)H-hydrate epimerase [Deltaproteobacteria bacterium HGW-Deltaproteobacteria-19]|jgi:NAD(P)H-hydrate epimerase|nr:MAG: bifunctional ADP-dependent NAD(P)H-hydrate dehydratase/NAD(P)H-hydrate epimerase [Deltaproteobacteria bacterium HGW-Deltaproteobacteria-19]
MKVAGVEEIRAMDRWAIEKLAIPEEILMENAGLAAVALLDREFGIAGKRFVVLCGSGNNGGDGLVVARKIHSLGGVPKVFLLGDPARFRGASATNFGILKRLPVDMRAADDLEEIRRYIVHADIVVDALLGTGLDRDVSGLYRDAIDLINDSGRRVLSLDIPSGVNGDTGEIMGVAVRACWTVTFGLPKPGNVLYPGFGCCGELFVSGISFPPELTGREDLMIALNGFVPLPSRDPEAHKGAVGDVLFIAGAAGYLGAPQFAALSFLKAGGGYARLAAPASIVPFLAQGVAEAVFIPQRETTSGSLSRRNKAEILALADTVDMVVLGPGLSLAAETQTMARELVKGIGKPVLIDGDGLTAVAADPGILRKRKAPTVLTPHPGEMARLTGKTTGEIRRNRIAVLQAAARDLKSTIVLKGAHSLIGCPDGRVFVNLSGNAGMATAGSGDVLTGAIAAMFGMGLPLEQAVRKGVFLHGLAGDLAADAKGEDGITARDILEFLPAALKQDRETPPAREPAHCRLPAVIG